jgi:streptogramin lyase
VRKWAIATKTLTTLAGVRGIAGAADGVGAAARLSQPKGGCVDGGALYLADSGNHTIRKIELATSAVTTFAGGVEAAGAMDGTGTNARFNRPTDVACDGAGHLYVADADNQAIRRITIANAAVDTPLGLFNARQTKDGTGTGARFDSPSYLVLNAGTLYVLDNGSSSVRKVRLSDFLVTTLAAQVPGLNVTGLAVDSAGTVYYSNRDLTVRTIASDGTVSVLAGSTTYLPRDGTGAGAGFESPNGLVFDGASSLYVAELYDSVVRRIALPSADVTTVAGLSPHTLLLPGVGRDANVLQPHGIVYDPTGAVLVGDDMGHAISRIDPETGTLSILVGGPTLGGSDNGALASARLSTVGGLVFDAAGRLFFSDWVYDTIRSISGGQLDTLAGSMMDGSMDGVGTAASFKLPEGVALDEQGDLYIADSFNHVIRKLELKGGNVTTPFGKAGEAGALDGTGTAARFNLPLDLLYDAGFLYVADSGNGAIRRIELASGAVTTFAGVLGVRGVKPGQLPARLNRPRGLVKMGAGQIGFLDEGGVFVIR